MLTSHFFVGLILFLLDLNSEGHLKDKHSYLYILSFFSFTSHLLMYFYGALYNSVITSYLAICTINN